MLIYERFFAHSQHSDTFNALNTSLAVLFFRSCLPSLAKHTDEHPAEEAAAEEGALSPEAAAAEAAAAAEEGRAEEEEERERKRVEWESRAGAIGKAVAEQLRAEPVTVRRDPAEETADFAKKGCCK
jgi:hypothetical protein